MMLMIMMIYLYNYKYICTNNIPVKDQYGFRIIGSTEAASYNVINRILKVVNNRVSVGGIFCDFEKASDCVHHGNAVDKLVFYKISGKFLTLIQSYLREG